MIFIKVSFVVAYDANTLLKMVDSSLFREYNSKFAYYYDDCVSFIHTTFLVIMVYHTWTKTWFWASSASCIFSTQLGIPGI